MEKKIVTFKGITNVPDDGLNEAGDMAVLMNMRHKGGELVPCWPPTIGDGAANTKQAVYHANSGYWLVLVNGVLRVKDEKMADVGYITGSVESFALMGNVVTIYKSNSVEYAIWRAGAFEHLGEMPDCEGLVSVSIGTNLFDKQETGDFVGGAVANAAAQVGAINKMLDSIYQEKGFVDRAWFRAAYRLFDGTYIKASQITQISWYGDGKFEKLNTPENCPGSDNTTNQLYWSDASTGKSYTSVHYFKPTIGLAVPAIAQWKDIIVGIDIFTTGSLMSFGTKQVKVTANNTDYIVEKYATLNEKEFAEKLINAEFYRYASYDIRGNKEFEADNTSPSYLAVQTVLTLPDQAVYTAKKGGSYNFKYHIFDYEKRLFKGYRLPKSFNASGENDFWSADIVALYVIVETEDGKKVVKRDPVALSEKVFGYFSFPDSRASKIIVEYSDGSQKLVELKPHPHRNEAYCVYVRMKQTGNGTVPVIINPESNVETPQEYTVDDKEAAKNILKVSAVDNPFYFPTAQTYKFEGEIKGLASNAEAISTGQFGQYPLFVFTDTGIWAMGVDTSGQGAYTTQSPFSREVCNGAICPVSGGVVFSTDKGVMVISGGQVADLSAALDGFEVDFFKYNAEMWNAIFAKAGKGVVNPVPIREYIKGAVLAYNYHYNEIILSNKARGYSYVYSLTNQVWSVIDTVFDLTTNKYPELVVFDKQGKMITFADGESGAVPVVAITRPFTLGSIDFKRIRQAGLRTTFDGQLNFYVLGSNDGAEFKCITGKEVDSTLKDDTEIQRDLITAMSRSKQYKYFAIAVVGDIEGRISMAELLVDAGFANNKIR